MKFEEILSPKRILIGAQAGSKKKTLELLGKVLSTDNELIDALDIVDSLCARERLSSTAIGGGVALPHARISDISSTVCAIVTLEQAVDFDALDGAGVDMFFALLVPQSANDEHLKVLSTIARLLNDEKNIALFRQCKCEQQLYISVLDALNISLTKGVA